jgi:ABC-2 type transport system permease protein
MLKYLLEKEFKQIRRNPFIPKMILIMPLMMMLVMPWAANQEIKGIHLSVVDHDHSTVSRRLIQKVPSSGYFKLTDVSQTNTQALKSIDSGTADIILEVPRHFERDLYDNGNAPVMISANAVNGMKAGLGAQYLSSIVSSYASDLREESGISGAQAAVPQCKVIPQYKFNPHLDYKVFMIPALMVMLLTMLGGFLPALSIVGEKETGTIEQINVTPVSKIMFVLAKLIPYWIIVLLVMALCMLIAFAVYGLLPVGHLYVILVFSMIYILVVSGMGLVISNYSNTMQQAMFVMWFFIMILILMSGLFTPVNSMPYWAQTITIFNPLRYFIQVMRQVYLKGSGFFDLLPQFFSLCCFASVLNIWAVLSYKKNS